MNILDNQVIACDDDCSIRVCRSFNYMYENHAGHLLAGDIMFNALYIYKTIILGVSLQITDSFVKRM